MSEAHRAPGARRTDDLAQRPSGDVPAPERRRMVLALCGGALGLVAGAACVSKPTMHLRGAAISGVRVSFPPALGVIMRVMVDVYNPNSYDVAVRAVRGQTVLGERYTMPVNFKAQGDGLWLASGRNTSIEVPVDIPVQTAMAVLAESTMVTMIPYRFSGRADVTATRTFRLEQDDYSIDERGWINRQQIQDAVRF
ncbi:MAG: hypothetical protein WKG00_30130 [Polyangiaceae bacterium]